MNKNIQTPNDESEEPEQQGPVKNYMTPFGFNQLQDELRHLYSVERPPIVATVRWAASNGDRSENGDYIYGKRRLREIDRRLRYLTKRLETAVVIDPRKQQHLNQVFFGATVKYRQEDGSTQQVKIVGLDEADLTQGKINWMSPLAKALLKSHIGDQVFLHTPTGTQPLTILSIHYECLT